MKNGILLSLVALLFIACGNDEDGVPPNPPEGMVGAWLGSSSQFSIASQLQASSVADFCDQFSGPRPTLTLIRIERTGELLQMMMRASTAAYQQTGRVNGYGQIATNAQGEELLIRAHGLAALRSNSLNWGSRVDVNIVDQLTLVQRETRLQRETDTIMSVDGRPVPLPPAATGNEVLYEPLDEFAERNIILLLEYCATGVLPPGANTLLQGQIGISPLDSLLQHDGVDGDTRHKIPHVPGQGVFQGADPIFGREIYERER